MSEARTQPETLTSPHIAPVVFTRRDGHIEARFGMTLENNPAEVWAALTTPDRLADWLAPGAFDARAGGAVKLEFVDSGTVIDSLITAFDPWNVLEFSWSRPGEPLRPILFELEPVGAMVGLKLTVTVPDTEDAGRSAAGWAAHLDMLAAALAGAPIRFPFEVFKAARETYRAQLASSEAP